MKKKVFLSTFLFANLFLLSTITVAQDSLNVTFRYYPNDNAVRGFVPGEFNGWGPNNAGEIATTAPSLMTENAEAGFWYKTIRLRVGGGTTTRESETGYAYKFHEHYNGAGTSWEWFSDPRNPLTVGPNSDSFLKIVHPLVFQMQPGNSDLITEDELEFWVNVSAKSSDPVDETLSEVYINDTLLGTFENKYDSVSSLLNFDAVSAPAVLDLLVNGENEFKIKTITDAGIIQLDSTLFQYIGELVTVDEARPAGLKDGITYSEADPTKVTLSLFAPEKKNVFVIGDFNDWGIDFDYQMKRDSLNADSVWFWLEIEGLTPGLQYGYQYYVDQERVIADPYSGLLLHPSEDQGISSSVFPNLKEYPTGKTSGYVSILEPGKSEYQWEVTDFEKPDKESLVIYELLIRDFLSDHSFNSLIDSLDYLERLGVNAIELMPVSEFDGNESWGYNPGSHIALDKYYGTPEAFKQFVDEAHKRGIAVILDVVMNHATGRHPLYQLYDFGENPYFNTSPKHEFNVFNDFNHQYSGTQYYNKRMIEHWINEYKVDGFRWDLTKGFTQNCTPEPNGCTSSYQQDRVDLLKKYADYQWAVDPDFYVIFEHLGTDQEESQWANYRIDEGKGIMLWGNMNGAYNEATMGYTSNLFGVLAASRSFEKQHLVGYMESHDEQWLMFKNRSFGACESFPSGGNGCETDPGSYNVRDLNTALGRQKLAGAFFFTLPGPKMIWQFGELGYGYGNNGEQCLKPGGDSNGDCAPSVADRVGNKPIRWDYWNNPDTEERINLYKTWSALLKLRKSSPAFTNPETALYALSNVVKRITLTHEDTDVVIIGNFKVTSSNVSVDYTKTGTWYDYFTGEEVEVSDVEEKVFLNPGEFKIFTTKEFETPEEGISVSNEGNYQEDQPTSFKLYQNYPNPFNPATNITFDIARSGQITLEVYDIVGRKVAELVNEVKPAGTHTITFDASSLSSGMYLVRLRAGQIIQTQKMTLLK
ncbi:MAG: T9SS type A sorting domain-containing protein [Balneolaceae bacterium]|nr:T9SS type A sorting domain-containing protein [Balneolaceae bacterium]MBO6546617.1 T9SS type A sorting domain-containing protein [Balneolaceae bacterium]MBO6648975.1 T9SS type A sorting domain-containing protein [Balneolaceae bacterium]